MDMKEQEEFEQQEIERMEQEELQKQERMEQEELQKQERMEQYLVGKKLMTKRINFSIYAIIVAIFLRLFSKHRDFNVVLNSKILIGVFALSILIVIGSIIFLNNIKSIEPQNDTISLLKRFNDLMDIAVVISIFVAIVTVLNVTLISVSNVEGNSMLPNFENDDDIVILHYPFMEYERFDPVVVKIEENVYYIKRIIGLPGETIEIKNQEIYVDGRLLDESSLGDLGETNCPVSDNVCSYVVGDDEYFVLGDNRQNSSDSRLFRVGNISSEDMYGVVIYRYQNIFRRNN